MDSQAFFQENLAKWYSVHLLYTNNDVSVKFNANSFCVKKSRKVLAKGKGQTA